MSPIVPRDFDVDFRAVPRHWMAGNSTATAVANGVNLLFPHGERFFVRSVKHFLGQIDDPALRAQIKGFFGQEGRHAHAHDEFNQILRAQGYEIDRFLDGYKRLASWLEAHTPPKLNLAVTAAAEHFTAILAEGAFSRNILDAAAPEMRQLLAWHAAEEIEHKAVAFDVLRAVDPSYALRILGLAYATATLGGFWLWGALTLMRQDRRTPISAWRPFGRLPRRDPIDERSDVAGGGVPDGSAGGAGVLPRGIDERSDVAGVGVPDGSAGGAGVLPRGIDERSDVAGGGVTDGSAGGAGVPPRGIVRRVFLRGIRQYLARNFHPNHNATERIASEWMVARGMSLPGVTPEAA